MHFILYYIITLSQIILINVADVYLIIIYVIVNIICHL